MKGRTVIDLKNKYYIILINSWKTCTISCSLLPRFKYYTFLHRNSDKTPYSNGAHYSIEFLGFSIRLEKYD